MNEDTQNKSKITFFFLDFGSNYFIENIDFKNKIIKLKDAYSYIAINFNINTKITYDTCSEHLKKITGTNDLTQDNIYKYYNEYFGSLIASDIYDKAVSLNACDILSTINTNKFLEESYPIGIFDTTKTKYVCIINFNYQMSKLLRILNNSYNIDFNTNMYLINISSSIINNYSKSNKQNGYSINLINAFWNSIQHNSKLIMQEHDINKMKFNLGHLFTGLLPKFYNLYIIFDSISSDFEKQSYSFISNFNFIKDKTKRAKHLNKMKNVSNKALNYKKSKALENNLNVNNITYALSNLNIIKPKNKKKTYKVPKYLNKDTEYDNLINESRNKQIHTICKNVTGSKHCYYEGYKDLITNFEKFELKQKQQNNKISLLENDLFKCDNDVTMNLEE